LLSVPVVEIEQEFVLRDQVRLREENGPTPSCTGELYYTVASKILIDFAATD